MASTDGDDKALSEFDCTECGYHIFSLGYQDGIPICGICRFINNIESPLEREHMRIHLRPNNREADAKT